MSIITRAKIARAEQQVQQERETKRRREHRRRAYADYANSVLHSNLKAQDITLDDYWNGEFTLDGLRFRTTTTYGYANLGPSYWLKVYVKKLDHPYEIRTLVDLANVLDIYGGPA